MERICTPLTHHILICLFRLFKGKYSPVYNGFDTIRVNRSVHVLKQHPTPHIHTSHHTLVAQALQKGWLLLCRWPAQKANYANATVNSDGLERLRHALWPSDFHDMVYTEGIGT